MENYGLIDIYATKGIEYLIVIVFLASFVLFSRVITARQVRAGFERIRTAMVDWFRVPDGLHYHIGHSWLRKEGDGLVTVGLDDFAQKFVGKPESIELPPVGTHMSQGDKGWNLKVEDRPVPMLSPVDGEIVAVNVQAQRDPEVVNRDPYGEGWLVKVRPTRLSANLRNLLTGRSAREWVRNDLDTIRLEIGGSLGPVAQDGGVPVSGIARALAGEQWEEKVRDYFRTG